MGFARSGLLRKIFWIRFAWSGCMVRFTGSDLLGRVCLVRFAGSGLLDWECWVIFAMLGFTGSGLQRKYS